MQQKQVYDILSETSAPEHLDTTQGFATCGTLRPAPKSALAHTPPRPHTLRQGLTAARRQCLLAALEQIGTDSPDSAQAWETLWKDTEHRAFYNVHYKSKKDGRWHTVPGLQNAQDREDLTSQTLATLFHRFAQWRQLSAPERLAWYGWQQRCQHISWYRRAHKHKEHEAGPPQALEQPETIPEDMQAAAQALCAASAAAERLQPLRLAPAGTAAAARVSAFLLPLSSTPEAATRPDDREAGLQLATQYEARDLAIKALALLQTLSVAPQGSKVLREGSIAILRICVEEGWGGALGQEPSLAPHAQELHVPAGTRRSQQYTTRMYLKAHLGFPDAPSRETPEATDYSVGRPRTSCPA
jgi:hypothetical protein